MYLALYTSIDWSPVGFVLSGSALLFSLIGHAFGLFDLAYLLALPNRIFGIMTNQNLLAVPMFILWD